ncbi:M20/M25/M40 family metallo-hydrolase, partial [Methylomagnum sp.]
AAIETVVGMRAKPDTGGGTSDGRFIAPTGTQVVEIGPLNGTIHKVNEHVSVEDIDTLSKIYEQILVNLLAP